MEGTEPATTFRRELQASVLDDLLGLQAGDPLFHHGVAVFDDLGLPEFGPVGLIEGVADVDGYWPLEICVQRVYFP